ncbi:MAG: ParM/StbA family protein [Hydrogenophaga sp.]|nr:ParM/StbA family protein [Hydrogenophaga sp.]
MKRDTNITSVPARAIDVGYANTKFTCGRKQVNGINMVHADLFPSITATLRPNATFMHAPGTHGADGCISEVNGVPHFAGRGVDMHLKGVQPRHVMKDYCTSPSYLALMRGAMHYMLEDAGNPQELAIEHLTVGLPLNTYLEYRDRLRSIVVGRHEVVSPDPSVGARHVTVVDASVMVQPMGALYNYGLTHPDFNLSGWNLVIDVGGGTIDFLVARDKAPNYERSGAHPESMLACASAVAKMINPSLRGQYSIIQEIDAAIRERKETIRISGVEYAMSDFAGAISDVLRGGYNAMLDTIGALEDFHSILVCGGGGAVFYDFLRENHPDLRPRLRIDAGSAFSNVRGFQIVAEYTQRMGSANR